MSPLPILNQRVHSERDKSYPWYGFHCLRSRKVHIKYATFYLAYIQDLYLPSPSCVPQ